MSDNKDNINHEQLKATVTKLYQDIEVPEPSNWDKVHTEIIKHNKRKKRMQSLKQICSVAAAALVISVLVNGNYSNVSAQFSAFVKVVKDEVTYIIMGKPNRSNHDAVTRQPNNNDLLNTDKYQNKKLEDNLLKLSFTPILPSYVPIDFEIQQSIVGIIDKNSRYNNLTIAFNNPDEEFIYIDYRNLNSIDFISSEAQMDYLSVNEFVLNGSHALYYESTNGDSGIEWITNDNIRISLYSRINKQELIKVAESIR